MSPFRAGNRAPAAVGEIPPAYRDWRYSPSPEVAVWPYFHDPDGDFLTFTATADDADVLSVAVAEGFVVVDARRWRVGTVTVTATDPGGLTAQQTFESGNVGPTPPRLPPGSVPPPPIAREPIPSLQVLRGQSAAVDLRDYFTDEPGLTFGATSSSSTVAVSVSGHTLTIDGVSLGEAVVEATASTQGGSTTQEFKVVVDPPTARLNSAPVFVGGRYRKVVPRGVKFVVDVSRYFSDREGDALEYAVADGGLIEAPLVAVRNGEIDVRVASASTIEVKGRRIGFTRIRMTAVDPGGLPASGELMVEVTRPVRR